MVTNKFLVTTFCITYKVYYTFVTDNNQPVRVMYCLLNEYENCHSGSD